LVKMPPPRLVVMESGKPPGPATPLLYLPAVHDHPAPLSVPLLDPVALMAVFPEMEFKFHSATVLALVVCWAEISIVAPGATDAPAAKAIAAMVHLFVGIFMMSFALVFIG